MSEQNQNKIIGAIIVWSVLISIGAAIFFKYFLRPDRVRKLENVTSAQSQYQHEITISLDSFSGYSVVRSKAFREELKSFKIRLNLNDDNADYKKRIRDLEGAKSQFAVFTVDSLILSSVELNDWPGTIILCIDESHGADAVVAYKTSMPNLNSLDDPHAKVVLTPDSPSEFMARIITAHFSLNGLPSNFIERADGSKDVYERFKSGFSEKKAYIMWEPDVSKALEEPDSHILLDSSKIKGHIVDVLVVQRQFLADYPDIADNVVEAYLRAAYSYQNEMVDLVLQDAKEAGEKLTKSQAENIVKGIRWKNTIENYAHFGIIDKSEAKGLDHIEDIIQKITDVLLKTNAFEADPFQGNYNKLFYDKTLSKLKEGNFHPGKKVNLLTDETSVLDFEDVRGAEDLPALSDDQWHKLVAVGKMKINPISFGRGKATFGFQSQRDLEELADKLRSWPGYYLLIVGHARKEGDQQLNKELAQQRAEAVHAYLVDQCGINPNRINAKAAKVFKRGGVGQSVSFVVGQLPY
ncbi:MAG: OmpA family protein [Candidatus Omnitrophica bacterium]|nr:OmpA family protein [Candidatus Omnitrophota bacterium]MBU4333300.1 OmpA family protein [Candidatus Omnitrophota bacterium]